MLKDSTKESLRFMSIGLAIAMIVIVVYIVSDDICRDDDGNLDRECMSRVYSSR